MSRRNATTEIITRKARCSKVKIADIKIEANHRLDNEIVDDKAVKKLKALQKSIEANGILNPIVAKKHEDGTFTIIDGIRRYEAAKRLGYKKLQVVSYDDIDDKEEMLSLVVNTNQKTLSPIELGIAYQKLIDRGVYRNKAELAKALGVSDVTVSSKIKNLELDARIIEDLLTGEGINDQKVLKAVRLLEKVNDDGESDMQHNAYTHIKTNSMDRKTALEHIASLNNTEDDTNDNGQAPVFSKTESDSEIQVVIEKEVLDEEVIEQIEVLLAEIERLSSGTEAQAAA